VRTLKLSLLTEKELDERYEGPNALDLTIEKYLRARLPWNWETLKIDPNKYLCGNTCGLCKKYYPSCKRCLLKSCAVHSFWESIMDAVRSNNREDFLRLTERLLEKMYEGKEIQDIKLKGAKVYLTLKKYAVLYKNSDGVVVCGPGLYQGKSNAEHYAPKGSEIVEVTVRSKKFTE
jgi:hypothetical protein